MNYFPNALISGASINSLKIGPILADSSAIGRFVDSCCESIHFIKGTSL
jgi:hypothetical protein